MIRRIAQAAAGGSRKLPGILLAATLGVSVGIAYGQNATSPRAVRHAVVAQDLEDCLRTGPIAKLSSAAGRADSEVDSIRADVFEAIGGIGACLARHVQDAPVVR